MARLEAGGALRGKRASARYGGEVPEVVVRAHEVVKSVRIELPTQTPCGALPHSPLHRAATHITVATLSPFLSKRILAIYSLQTSQTQTGPGAVFDAVALRHPAGIGGRNNGAFVPNDVRLGGSGSDSSDGSGSDGGAAPPFILLSGPNMGGKSTLLRQTCLAAILAQVGAAGLTDALWWARCSA